MEVTEEGREMEGLLVLFDDILVANDVLRVVTVLCRHDVIRNAVKQSVSLHALRGSTGTTELCCCLAGITTRLRDAQGWRQGMKNGTNGNDEGLCVCARDV